LPDATGIGESARALAASNKEPPKEGNQFLIRRIGIRSYLPRGGNLPLRDEPLFVLSVDYRPPNERIDEKGAMSLARRNIKPPIRQIRYSLSEMSERSGSISARVFLAGMVFRTALRYTASSS
jgi:hypothetical protein